MGRYALENTKPSRSPLSTRWWRDGKAVIPGARPTVANSSLPVAMGFATTLISFLILQILLIAMALGDANYDGGVSGAGAATGFTIWSALVIAVSCGLGAVVTARQLRRADVEERGCRQVGALGPALAATAIAINGLAAGGGLGGVLVVGLSAGLSTALGARIGSRPTGLAS
jgi:hypothetical protein